ncbi:unnamed protein product [Danaus chrysippus]|uniref:(African queen) hypothetical protein n=1 Tax=Danaus chrysippus TaxID=151541 RepID=A0A8J2QTA0_9NEOP|nr:unnamed protein product [Danaus chrysippus]
MCKVDETTTERRRRGATGREARGRGPLAAHMNRVNVLMAINNILQILPNAWDADIASRGGAREPNVAEPSRAGPSRAEQGRRAEPSRAGAEPRAGAGRGHRGAV